MRASRSGKPSSPSKRLRVTKWPVRRCFGRVLSFNIGQRMSLGLSQVEDKDWRTLVGPKHGDSTTASLLALGTSAPIYLAGKRRTLARQPMSKLKRLQSRARELARSGKFYGWPPLVFELRFEDGFSEAREWLHRPATRDELDRICQEARKRHLNLQDSANEAA
jgi:hypothetical protein